MPSPSAGLHGRGCAAEAFSGGAEALSSCYLYVLFIENEEGARRSLQLGGVLRKHPRSQFHVLPLQICQAGRRSQLLAAPSGCEGADVLMLVWFCPRDGVAAKWKDLQNGLNGPCVELIVKCKVKALVHPWFTPVARGCACL